MTSRLGSLAWICCALIACKQEPAQVADVVIPVAPGSSWLTAQRSAGLLPSPLDGWVLAGGGPQIGSPCNQDQGPTQAAARVHHETCGAAGRVSVEHRPHALAHDETIPCEWRTRRPTQVTDVRSFCVSGDHLVIVWRCFACRALNSGDVIHAKLSELTDEQHAWLHSAVGLERGSGPVSVDEWRALAAATPP